MTPDLRSRLTTQDGVVARAQLNASGVRPSDLERMVRRRDLVRVLPGVFVNHTGPLSWTQRAWVGVLHFAPAALAGASAVRAAGGSSGSMPADTTPISIAVAADRRVTPVDGFRVVRTRALAGRVNWQTSPPRIRIEHALLDVAAGEVSDFAALEALASGCRSRLTTPTRLSAALDSRPRLRRRAWLQAALTEIAGGSTSVLEHGYLRRVERPHGLPKPARQTCVSLSTGHIYRDVDYEPFGLIVELDGRLFHDTARQRDRDLDRDLQQAVGGMRTVRLGWGQVYERGCVTAGIVGGLLVAGGWHGMATPCSPVCPLVTLPNVSAQ